MASAKVIALRPGLPALPAPADPFLALPAWAREIASERQALIRAFERGEAVGVSEATIRRWRKAWQDGGALALAPGYHGRARKAQTWDARALELIELPQRMNSGEVAANIRADGFGSVTPAQVRRLRKTLPSNRDETSPKKLGPHHYRLNETPYVIRDWGEVPVGYVYEMDGHSCDFYIEHPITGKHFRPELTFLIDVRSQYIVDFWLGGFENSMDLRWLVSRAFIEQDHVCRELHVDPGAARAKTMTDPISGWCAKLDVAIHFALPGNARGKGLVEGEYKHFEGRFGKLMPTYLHNRTDDAMRLFSSKWKKGLVPRITVKQLHDLILARYVEPRRTEPRKGLRGKSPAELWATLKHNPVMAPASVLCRPRAKRVVQNGRVTIHKRRYELPQPWRGRNEDRQVIVEYDEWRDQQVWIYTLDDRFETEALLVHRRAGIPMSRVEERMAATVAGQRKRLELKIAEAEARSRLVVTPAAMLAALEAPETPAAPSEAELVLASRSSFTHPALPAPPPVVPVDPAAVQRLAETVAADAAEIAAETETADERMARALALEARQRAGEILVDDDARWLAIYATSAEYHSRRALIEEFGDINRE